MMQGRHQTDLQVELIAGISSVQFRTGESKLSLAQGCRMCVPVAHLPQCLLIVSHRIHTYTQKHRKISVTLQSEICGIW